MDWKGVLMKCCNCLKPIEERKRAINEKELPDMVLQHVFPEKLSLSLLPGKYGFRERIDDFERTYTFQTFEEMQDFCKALSEERNS